MGRRSQPAKRERGRELFALFFSFVLTVLIVHLIIPPGSRGPAWLAIVVYVLVYATLYVLLYRLVGLMQRRP